MSTLILYASKSGASEECAHLLRARLDNCSICNLAGPTPDLEPYGTLILGSGIRMGRLYKPIRAFIQQHRGILLSKSTAFFFCNYYPEKLQKAIGKGIPRELAVHAVCMESFGGKAPFSSPMNQDWVRLDRINAFAQAIQDLQGHHP